mmetsp:Transcript_4129/g.6303  ORF Transcript_4129/g.6303 Transcript_4129/m.6303 type:complete len:502 (+) Transcript_4129:44-1549(+)
MPNSTEKAAKIENSHENQKIGLSDVKKSLSYIVRATETSQQRWVLRAIRNTTKIRRNISPKELKDAFLIYVKGSSPILPHIFAAIDQMPEVEEEDSMEVENPVEGTDKVIAREKWEEKAYMAVPEIEAYLCLLFLAKVINLKMIEIAVETSTMISAQVIGFNRRSLDYLKSKIIFYQSLAYEKAGRIVELRRPLTALHRTCCLRHDEIGQVTVFNLLVRSLLNQNLIEQAHKFASKTNFPEGCSNNQYCRYLYYTGKICALQLDYSDAYTKLTQCARKAPQNTALSFRIVCQKLIIIVQLLLGEVPERIVFNLNGMKKALFPYLCLTHAVRLGDLVRFSDTVQKYAGDFQADKTFTLIQRLAHNVIKAGLRKVNIAYSCISIADICEKVKLDSLKGAEFVCAKAINDGVIDASIDHSSGNPCLKSREQGDLYATDEPQKAFHRRITFCLDIHNEAVRAMRYPEDAYKRDLENAHRKGLQDDKTEEELAKEIEEEMDEEDEL